MTVEIHGSRRTIARRYEMHAEQKRQQALSYMPPPGSGSIFPARGPCHHDGFGMGYGFGMGGFGCPGMGFGGMPNWMNQFFVGSSIGQSLFQIGNKLFGKFFG